MGAPGVSLRQRGGAGCCPVCQLVQMVQPFEQFLAAAAVYCDSVYQAPCEAGMNLLT